MTLIEIVENSERRKEEYNRKMLELEIYKPNIESTLELWEELKSKTPKYEKIFLEIRENYLNKGKKDVQHNLRNFLSEGEIRELNDIKGLLGIDYEAYTRKRRNDFCYREDVIEKSSLIIKRNKILAHYMNKKERYIRDAIPIGVYSSLYGSVGGFFGYMAAETYGQSVENWARNGIIIGTLLVTGATKLFSPQNRIVKNPFMRISYDIHQKTKETNIFLKKYFKSQ